MPPSSAVLSATGLFTPPHSISNDELVAAFNRYVAQYNAEHAADIAAGRLEALAESSSEFIEKASGIRSRFVMDKQGILDPARMCPQFAPRPNEALSLQAEIGVAAAQDALAKYFDTRAKNTQTAQALLRQVQASNLAIEMPTLSDSLTAVRNYKAKS